MRWRGGRRSSNVEDRRGRRIGGRGFKLGGGMTLIIVVVALFLGQDPVQVLNLIGGFSDVGTSTAPSQQSAGNDEQADFVSVVLADTEDTWQSIFAGYNAQYSPPKLVLYTDQVQSACGLNSAATGPFYCPGDSKVYLDLGFFQELSQRLGAPGDFASAYVIAHEIGHHIQNLTGTSRKVHEARRSVSEEQANALSVLQELQADCYAGVWAHHAQQQRNILEQGDIEEGLNAAASIGDDRLQRMAGRAVRPESFTHGSSAQRTQWFRIGLEQGTLEACDTFNAVAQARD